MSFAIWDHKRQRFLTETYERADTADFFATLVPHRYVIPFEALEHGHKTVTRSVQQAHADVIERLQANSN